MTPETALYDEEGAAKYIGGADSPVSTRTMQRWRLEGVGPTYVKLGRLVRYRQSDLDAFLEKSMCTSTSMRAPTRQDNALPEKEMCHD
jgi:hypothetical protein